MIQSIFSSLTFTVFWVSMTQATNAALLVDIGDHVLLPDTPNQTITVTVSGGDSVQGLNFNLQIDDDGVNKAPSISAVDITGPQTIFGSNNTGQVDQGTGELVAGSQFGLRTTTAAAGTVIADGILALVTLDTTGRSEGSFTLNLANTLNGPTDFAGLAVSQFDNGSLTIAATAIPEPGSCVLFGMIGLVFASSRRRTSRIRGRS